LVWIDRKGAATVAACARDAQLYPVVNEWIVSGRPLVVRCQPPHVEAAGRLAVGLPLPPFLGKRRIALEVDLRAIMRVASPPSLAEIIDELASGWRDPLLQLSAGAAEIDIEFRVFGSAAWQLLTGLPYLTSESDIDLLWRPATNSQLAQGVALLEAWERAAGICADGEILLGDDAVSWREWARDAGPGRLMAKHWRGAALRTRAELLEQLASWRTAVGMAVAGTLACA
jgi:phosphoribosyl-dephospho-CoA transferase